MTKIHLHRHPFAKDRAEVIEVEHLGEWLRARIESSPMRRPRRVFRGPVANGIEISADILAIMASDAPAYTVMELPGIDGGLTAFQIFQAVLAAYAVASAFMASKPKMPANVNRSQQSPNNALGSRENQVRMMQRVEDIFGTVKAIPSLMMPTYTKYVDNVKVEYGYYCLGRGYYAIDSATIKDGDTPIANITGSSCAVYAPFVSPNNGGPFIQIGAAIIDSIVTVRRSVEVDGITLKAQNQIQLEANSGYILLPPGPEYRAGALYAPASDKDRIVQFWKRPNFNAVVTAGQTITLAVPDRSQVRTGPLGANSVNHGYYDPGFSAGDPPLFEHLGVGGAVTIAGFPDAGNNGTFTVVTKPDAADITVTPTTQVDTDPVPDVTVTVPLPGAPFSGTRTVQEVGDGWLILTTATFPYQNGDPLDGTGPNTNVVANNGLTDWTDWVTVPTVDLAEIWVNVIAAQGMYKDDGGLSTATVYYDMQLQQLDGSLNPVGGVITATGSLTGVTTAERAETLEYATPWTGATRVRLRRTTPFDYFFQGSVIDEIKWADLNAVSPVARPHFGNKTTFHTVTEATERSTAVKNRQLSCIGGRLIPHWTGSSFTGGFDGEGRHTWGTLQVSPYVHDVIACMTLDPKIGNRPQSDLDMPQLQSVTDQLFAIHPDLPTFNYTLDSDNLSFEDSVQLVANACFSTAYRQGGKIRLGLDRKQTFDAALFTHRNKEPNAETRVRTFANDADYDGVEFVYQDPDTLQAETIRLPLDGSATKYKQFEIPGIRSFAQAWIRANREYRKLLGQRISIETSCTTDARLLLPNVRVGIVDSTRFKSYDGDIVAQSEDGLTLTLSQPVSFAGPGSFSIVLIQRSGTLQGITVTEVEGRDDQVRLATLPAEAVKTTTDQDGVATIFSFGSNDSRMRQSYIVGDIDPPKSNYMTVRGVNYSDSYYEADTQPIPPRDSVINA